MANSELLGTRTFPAFLLGEGMQDLQRVRRVYRPQAECRQRQIARKMRDDLRSLLRRAAQLRALPWGTVHIADFARSGEVQPTEFVTLDEDLPGDTAFNPVDLTTSAAATTAAAATISAAATAAATTTITSAASSAPVAAATGSASATATTASAPSATEPTDTAAATAEAEASAAQEPTAWLILGPLGEDTGSALSSEVGSTVNLHLQLVVWGPARVLQVPNGGEMVSLLGVLGRWVAAPGPAGAVTWFSDRAGSDALTYSGADDPTTIPALVQFRDPVLADPTHVHTFYFPDQSHYARACEMLGIAHASEEMSE